MLQLFVYFSRSNFTESREAYFRVDVYSVALQNFLRGNKRLIKRQKVMLAIKKMAFLTVKSNKLCLIIHFIIIPAFFKLKHLLSNLLQLASTKFNAVLVLLI